MRVLPFLLAVVPLFAQAAPPPVQEGPLRAHLAFLADDLLEGRGTGQRGGACATPAFGTEIVYGAGILLVHTTPSASYGWPVVRNGWDIERFQLAQGPQGAPLEGWVTGAVARALAKQGGQDLDALRAAAQRRDFRPIPLDLRLKGTLQSAVRTLDQSRPPATPPDPLIFT